MAEPAEYLFVYGTLRRAAGHPARSLLAEGAEPVGTGRLRARLFQVSGYPGAVPSDDPADQVVGDVFRLTAPTTVLGRLDEYEEAAEHFPAPREYRRERAEIRLQAGRSVTAWVYFYNRPTNRLKPIASGDYCANGGKTQKRQG